MAGGVAKTFGAIFTLLAGLLVVLGMGAVVYGATTMESETDTFPPNEDRAEAAANVFVAGLGMAAVGWLLLLVFLPLLVWGTQREEEPETGRAVTRPGGALKAWGVTFLVLGLVALLAGLVAFVYGGSVLDAESQRLFRSEDRAEAAAAFAAGGAAVAGVGLVLTLLAIPFLVGAGQRAQRATLAASVPGRGAPFQPHPAAGHGRGSWRAAQGGLALAGLVSVGAVVLLLLFSAPGSPLGNLAAPGAPGGTQEAVRQTFEGRLTGGALPLLGDVGNGKESAQHLVQPQANHAVVEAVLDFEPGPTDAKLLLVLEAKGPNGEYREVGRAAGGSGLAVRSDPQDLHGEVRATLRFAEGSGGDVSYSLVVNVAPA